MGSASSKPHDVIQWSPQERISERIDEQDSSASLSSVRRVQYFRFFSAWCCDVRCGDHPAGRDFKAGSHEMAVPGQRRTENPR